MTLAECTAAGRRALLESGPRAARAVRLYRVLRVGSRYHVRASMRPYPPAVLHRVSSLPRGTLASEPIPIEWFKAPRHYRPLMLNPNPAAWAPATPPAPRRVRAGSLQRVEVPPRQRIFGLGGLGIATGTPPRIMLGILPWYWPRPLKLMRRQHSGSLGSSARRVQGAMRRFFANYRVNLTDSQIDHVQDIGWNGPDAVNNLWPADTEMNQLANRSYGQTVWYDRGGVAVRSNPGQLYAPTFVFQIRIVNVF